MDLRAPGTREARFPGFTITGPPGAPVVVVLGGISATQHVVSHGARRGWLDGIAGDHKVIDSRRYRVLGLEYADAGRREDGRPRHRVTTHDQADRLLHVLDALRIRRVHALVGYSYGGMVALAFAEHHQDRIGQLVVCSAPHEPHPMSTALRSLQRRIVELGLDTGRVVDAMNIARGLAMTSYRTATEFAERFVDGIPDARENNAGFSVDRYLRHCGRRFADTMAPERFLALSLSADLHRIDPTCIRTQTTIVAAEGDTVVPRSQLESLASCIRAHTELVDLPTRVGHDAFLVETNGVSSILAKVLDKDLVQ